VITIGKTYNIFISHAWKYNEHYYRLENMLKNAPNFLWRNYSVPKHDPKIDPNTPVGKRTLKKELEKQVKPSSCVIVIAGMYSHYREWIQEEIKMAKRYKKPIIAVKPRGNLIMPTVITNNADEVVGWNTNSIVNAIKRLA